MAEDVQHACDGLVGEDITECVGSPDTQVYDDVDGSQDVDEDEEVDPRVQGELETLNSASDDINTLETELEKSRNKFHSVLVESTQHLNLLFKKLGKCVLKARPYYDLMKQSKQAQAEAQKAAVCFQRANSIYHTAKEMVQLAEEKHYPEDGDRRRLDAAWQEMLNHATIKFMESEKNKAESEEEHLVKAEQYAAIQQKVRYYEKDMPRNISKARPYFDLKDKLEHQLQIQRMNVEDLQMGLIQRMNVEDLQMGLVCAKHKYRSALTSLEEISEEIHRKRNKRLKLPPRTPGVGAESDISSLPSVNLDNLSDTASFMSVDDLDGDWDSMKDNTSCDNFSGRIQCPMTMEDKVPSVGPSHTSDVHTTDTLPPDVTPVTEKIREVSLGERQAVVEGSESIALTSHQEAPLSSEQLAMCPGYVGMATDVSKLMLPHERRMLIPRGQSAPGVKSPGMSGSIRPQNTGFYSNKLSLDMQKTHKSPTKRQQQKLQTQMAFPILQGLTASHMIIRPGVNQNRSGVTGSYGNQSGPHGNYGNQPALPQNYSMTPSNMSSQPSKPPGGDTSNAHCKLDQPEKTKKGKDEVFV